MNYRGLGRIPSVLQTGTTWPHVPGYRYPTERWLLIATLLIIGVGLVLSGYFSFTGFAIFFIFGFAFNYFFIRSYIEGLKRDAVQVSDTQFPQIKELVDESRRYVDVSPDTRVFVTYSPYMNAFAVGLGRPYSIVLFSALVDNLDADELKYVISHEMGHIKFGHTIWLTLIGQLGTQTYGVPFLGGLFRFCFLFWSRAAELTADRAGLVGCGKLDKAISAEVKFGAGPWLARWVDAKALARQARESTGNVFAAFRETWGTHPLMTTRIRRLVNFATSETFRILRPDAHRGGPNSRPKNNADPQPGPPAPDALPERSVIRRLAPKNNATPDTTLAADLASTEFEETAAADSSPPPDNAAFSDTPPATEWSKKISFNRLNVSAIRANVEQAEMWLRLGELLQSYGQSGQAGVCMQRAQALINGSALPTTAGEQSFTPQDLALAAGQSPAAEMATTAAAAACPTCGTTNQSGTHYCYHCRTQLKKPCLECGIWLPANYPNCPHCGQNQAQIIATLKAEANSAKKIAQQPLPPRRLTRWEAIYGSIFLIDIMLILSTLAWQSGTAAPVQTAAYIAGAILTLQMGIIVVVIWTKRRTRRYWHLFDEVDLATQRYNEIADTLARQNVVLDPPQIAPKDPWQWAHS